MTQVWDEIFMQKQDFKSSFSQIIDFWLNSIYNFQFCSQNTIFKLTQIHLPDGQTDVVISMYDTSFRPILYSKARSLKALFSLY